jgi:hypothetical protein
MKKLYLIFTLLGITAKIMAVNVTFQVDMSQQTVSPQGTHCRKL